MFSGILNSALDNFSTTFVQFEFQKRGDERRVIISVGSSDSKKLFSQYADGIAHSMYLANSENRVAVNTISSTAGSMYHDLTGNKLNLFDTYDLEVTVDKAHKNNPYSSYLWIAGDGTIMETPIIYSGDEVKIVSRGFWGFGHDVLASVPLGGSSPVSPEYQAIFDKYR